VSNPQYDFGSAEIVPNLPDWLHPNQGDPLPDGLIGATIIRMGTLPEARSVSGGGLVIDYRRKGESSTRRLILAFNEAGMWAEQEIILHEASK
jgi:hypothetical protein